MANINFKLCIKSWTSSFSLLCWQKIYEYEQCEVDYFVSTLDTIKKFSLQAKYTFAQCA